jgi:hypothetical protein
VSDDSEISVVVKLAHICACFVFQPHIHGASSVCSVSTEVVSVHDVTEGLQTVPIVLCVSILVENKVESFGVVVILLLLCVLPVNHFNESFLAYLV